MSDGARTLLADAEVPAIKAWVDALQANKTAVFEGRVIESDVPDHDVRKDAAQRLLDRRLGKPTQTITGVDDTPLVQSTDLTTLTDAQFAALVALRDALKAGK